MDSPVCWCCCYVSPGCTASLSVCWVVWHVSLSCLGHIQGWVQWSSAHWSISSVAVMSACRKTPNISTSYLYCMLVIIVWCSGLPYSCLLLRMCGAYAETSLFVLIYHICLWYLIAIDLPVWPTYDLLHVLHCNLYIPLEAVLFCGDLSRCWLYVVLRVWNAMFRLVHLNRWVTLCMSGLWYVNVIHFFLCVCVGGFSAYSILIILFFKL
jgi:hypothetical protein